MRASVRTVLVALVLVAAACFTYRPAAAPPAPGAHVRIVLRPGAAVETVPDGGDGARRSYPDVVEVHGTVRSAGDTLAIRLGELSTATGAVPGESGRIALVPADAVAAHRERKLQLGRTLLLVGGLALLIETIAIALVVSIPPG